MAIWHKFLPTYGNWGGAGYSGGCFPESPKFTNWLVNPADSMDELFKMHDRQYQYVIKKGFSKNFSNSLFATADKQLLRELCVLPKDPVDWINPPVCDYRYARFFRWITKFIFRLKIKFLY